MAMEFRVGFGPLTDLVSWSVFALGVGNLFWTPLAMCVGKRPVVLISMVVFLAGLIWSVKAPTINSLLGARILASFGAGSVESLGPSMIGDMYMERYFATSMALFSLFLSAGSQVGPAIAGYLIADRGWRWFFILCAILNGLNLFSCLFLLPETSYRRPYVQEGETAADADREASEKAETGHFEMPSNGEELVQDHERIYSGYWHDLVSFRNRGQEEAGLLAFLKQLSLPFRFLIIPGALYAALAYGIMLAG
jgi:MFS family permease